MTIGELLEEKGLSRYRLSKISGVPWATLADICSGKTKFERCVFPYLNRIEKMLTEQGFKSRRAEEGDIKRILGVYFEQNVTTEQFEEFDGERWIILND